MHLTNQFPNVFVQGLNLAKNRPTSLIWEDYSVLHTLIKSDEIWFFIMDVFFFFIDIDILN